jgi:hypothetical protein
VTIDLEARIAAAFARAATEMEVASRPFDAGGVPAPTGRGVRLSSPKPPGADRRPGPELDARPPSNGPRRGHRLMAAAAVVVVLAMGAAAFRHAGSSDAGSGAGSGKSSLRTVERDGAIDPMLLDYVFPVNGDDWAAALDRFDVDAARAEVGAVAECVRSRGQPGVEPRIVDVAWQTAWNTSLESLPSLSALSSASAVRVFSPPSVALEVALACEKDHRTAWDRWRIDAAELRSLDHLRRAIAEVERTPVWTAATTCMTEAGASPAASDTRHDASDESGPPTNRASPGYLSYVERSVMPPETFVRCLTPFFAEVERVLQKPRAAFVKEHRKELLELQRRFEAFTGPGG